MSIHESTNKSFLFISVMKNAPQHTCPQVAGFGITDKNSAGIGCSFTRGAVATVVVLIVIFIMTFIIVITIIITTE